MPARIPYDYVPQSEADLWRCLADPMWRLFSGQLYWIMMRDDADESGFTAVPFKPRPAQIKLVEHLWHRNLILKARQLGFTTLVALMWLDHAMFNENQRCGIISYDEPSAETIFRDKIKFAYDRLPAFLKEAMPLKTDNVKEIVFGHNNSSIRVSTTMRSGTIHRLHISEFGKIGANSPKKAKEVVTGSLPAVPIDGITIIESTAEGQEGEFYRMAMKAIELHELKRPLTMREFRLHFFPWFESPEYAMEPRGVVITAKDHEYFDQVEGNTGRMIPMRQRAWYCATRDSDFSGDPSHMWQEYPSTPKEAFQVSLEGTYYAVQLAAARMAGRIGSVPMISGVPVNTFWDIGVDDGTGIWFHQEVGAQQRFIRYIEGYGEPYSYFIAEMQKMGCVWGTHWLPHDAKQRKQFKDAVLRPVDMLEELQPRWDWQVVDRVQEIIHGIQAVRDVFSECWFDETGCAEGLRHISLYRKEWNDRVGGWKDKPHKDEHTEAADALRQFAQVRAEQRHFGRTDQISGAGKKRRRGAMAA